MAGDVLPEAELWRAESDRRKLQRDIPSGHDARPVRRAFRSLHIVKKHNLWEVKLQAIKAPRHRQWGAARVRRISRQHAHRRLSGYIRHMDTHTDSGQ